MKQCTMKARTDKKLHRTFTCRYKRGKRCAKPGGAPACPYYREETGGTNA